MTMNAPFLFFILIPLLMLSIPPWQKSRAFIGVQVLKFIVGCIYSFILFYFVLIDVTWSAFIAYAIWAIALSHISDLIFRKGSRLRLFAGIGGSILIVILIGMFTIYPLSIKQERSELAQVEVSGEHVGQMDIEHIPVVPHSYASYKTNQIFGQVENYAYYTLGYTTIQDVGNELVWVTPIEFGGFFKQRRAETSPGYITVSATDPSENARLHTGHEMMYTPSNYFGDNLIRKIRMEFPEIRIMETTFQIDNDGKPYYVTSFGDFHKFRFGRILDGVVVMDPANGEFTKYEAEHIPDFVSQAVPANMASDYNYHYGKYKLGFWNALFAKQGVHIPTEWGLGSEKVIGVYDNEGDLNWFTDHTVDESDATSMVGYSLMDARTGAILYFDQASGFLNGDAASLAVNETFLRDNRFASDPTIYNIYGEITWVIPVVDPQGLLREIALVHAESGSTAIGENKREAFREYQRLIIGLGDTDVSPSDLSDFKTITGTVERVVLTPSEDTFSVELIMENSDVVFRINPNSFLKARFIQSGDELEISYLDTGDDAVVVEDLQNNSLE